LLGHQLAADLIGLIEQLLLIQFDGRGVVAVREIQQARMPICR